MLQWCYSGVTVMLQVNYLLSSFFLVVIRLLVQSPLDLMSQWCYSGVAIGVTEYLRCCFAIIMLHWPSGLRYNSLFSAAWTLNHHNGVTVVFAVALRWCSSGVVKSLFTTVLQWCSAPLGPSVEVNWCYSDGAVVLRCCCNWCCYAIVLQLNCYSGVQAPPRTWC
jgi:hypothetical protein